MRSHIDHFLCFARVSGAKSEGSKKIHILDVMVNDGVLRWT